MDPDRKTTRAQREIDTNLRRAYGDLINQDVPDRFTNLLAELRRAETDRSETARRDNDQDS